MGSGFGVGIVLVRAPRCNLGREGHPCVAALAAHATLGANLCMGANLGATLAVLATLGANLCMGATLGATCAALGAASSLGSNLGSLGGSKQAALAPTYAPCVGIY